MCLMWDKLGIEPLINAESDCLSNPYLFSVFPEVNLMGKIPASNEKRNNYP